MHTSSSSSFKEIKTQLDEIATSLSESSINYKNTRLNTYLNFLNKLVSLHEQDKFEDINMELMSHLNALYEANELIFIYRTLLKYEKNLGLENYTRIILGPEYYFTENASSSNKPRNTAFEFLVASRFKMSGISVLPNTEPDIIANHAGINIYIACKRIRSINKINRNVKYAFKQITDACKNKNSETNTGIAAIDISRIVNPYFKLLVGEDCDELSYLLETHCSKFIESNEHAWNGIKYKHVIGVLVRLSCMAIDKKQNNYTYCQQYVLHPISPKGTHNYNLATELAKKMISA